MSLVKVKYYCFVKYKLVPPSLSPQFHPDLVRRETMINIVFIIGLVIKSCQSTLPSEDEWSSFELPANIRNYIR